MHDLGRRGGSFHRAVSSPRYDEASQSETPTIKAKQFEDVPNQTRIFRIWGPPDRAETYLHRSGSSCCAVSTQKQPNRLHLRPSRGHFPFRRKPVAANQRHVLAQMPTVMFDCIVSLWPPTRRGSWLLCFECHCFALQRLLVQW